MDKIRIIAIIASFFCLWLTSFLNEIIEVILGFMLIFSFGILHGSNDIFIIDKLRDHIKRFSYYKVLLFYILFVLVALVLFYLFPLLALTLFIIFSAYHFGEQHWENDRLRLPYLGKQLFYSFYGLFILSLLFWLQQERVIIVIETISGYVMPTTVITALFFASSIGLGIMSSILLVKDAGFRTGLAPQLLYIFIFAVIFKVGSLIWGFGIYFVFWHSLPSLHDQIKFLYGDVDAKSIKRYFKQAFPFWMISIVGIALLYVVFRNMELFYALFFSFLAAVTFPHSLAITTMFKRKKKNASE